MTAVFKNHVYIVGKQKSDADKLPKADAKRIAEAVAHVSQYKKK